LEYSGRDGRPSHGHGNKRAHDAEEEDRLDLDGARRTAARAHEGGGASVGAPASVRVQVLEDASEPVRVDGPVPSDPDGFVPVLDAALKELQDSHDRRS